VCGPYSRRGRDANEIFDIAFGPERQKAVKWRPISREQFEEKTIKWKIVDGAMEVGPRTGSIISRQKFGNFKLHLEFRTPFMPEAREQKRGNSGVYLQGRYEVQILDSYGLEGKDNECGGIYKVAPPLVNAAAPPLQWQTYDITFCAPKFDADGKKIANARITALHNGIKIHDNTQVPGPTGFPPDSSESKTGAISLQDHGDKVQFRNIWLVELPDEQCK
jgi:hypothetical protein